MNDETKKTEGEQPLKSLVYDQRPEQEAREEMQLIAMFLLDQHPKIKPNHLAEIIKLKYSLRNVMWQKPIRMAVLTCTDTIIPEKTTEGVRLTEGELLLHLTNNFMVCAFESFINMLPSILESDIDGKGKRKLSMAFKLDFATASADVKASAGTKTSFETSEKIRFIPTQKEMDFQPKGDNEKTQENQVKNHPFQC